MITYLHYFGTFIGCGSQNTSSINWPYLLFVAITSLLPSIWSGTYTGSLTTTLSNAFDWQRHTSWWHLGEGSALSAIVRLELPVLVREQFAIVGRLCTIITGCFQEESEDPASYSSPTATDVTCSTVFNLLSVVLSPWSFGWCHNNLDVFNNNNNTNNNNNNYQCQAWFRCTGVIPKQTRNTTISDFHNKELTVVTALHLNLLLVPIDHIGALTLLAGWQKHLASTQLWSSNSYKFTSDDLERSEL